MNIAKEAERLDRQRDLSLMLQLAGFTVWRGADMMLRDLGWHPAGISSEALMLISMSGWLIWFAGLGWLIWLLVRLRNRRQLQHVLNDEGIVRNRTRALQASFWSMLVCLVVGRVAIVFVPVSSALVLDFLIWVIVVSQIGGYLWFSRA